MLTRERIQLTEHIHSFNITAYNQRPRATPFRKRKSNSTSFHNYSLTKMRASTAMSETQPIPEDRCKSVEKQSNDLQNLNKNTLKDDNRYKKRRHITDSYNNTYGVSLFTKNSEIDVNKDQGATAGRKNKVGSILQSKRSTIGPTSITSKVNYAKQSKTGKQLVLNDSHFQSWINQVLLQSCEQKFDKSINLCAVKKYMIDIASLAAFGIKQSEISRIYRSLHVYSVGFSQLIKEIRQVSNKAYRNIWKVYSILLEHCSTGDFQTMMTEIENQNARILQRLEDQLQEKQEIIQQNDQLNRQKNSKVFKELKTLKDQNFQLILEKDVIINDARQFQKAFGQEVSLRMLFEEKISSIYCMYNELSSKHSALYKDFNNKNIELGLLQEQYKRISEQNGKIKNDMIGIKSDDQILTHQLVQAKEQIIRLENKYRTRLNQENQLKLQRSNISKKLLEAQQQCKKMAKQVHLIKENNKLLIQTNHLQQLEYEQCLNQNKRLLSTLQQQFAINKRYFQERLNLDKGLINYENDKAIFQIKIYDRQKIIQELKNKIQDLQYRIHQEQSERELAEENITKLNEDVRLAEENIKKLNIINQHNQRTIQEQQMKITLLETQLKRLLKVNQHVEARNKEQIQQIIQLECKNRAQNLEIQLLNQKLGKQIKAKQKTKQIETIQRKKQQKEFNIIRKESLNKQIQVDKLKQVYDNTSLQLKNERFQMKNLELRYNQCLTVIENYNKVIKDIHTKHSDLQGKLQEQKRISKIRQVNYENKIKKLESQNKTMNRTVIQLTELRLKHKICIHPMIFQDIYSTLQRYQEKEMHMQKVLSTLQLITRQAEKNYRQTMDQKQKQIGQLKQNLKNTVKKLSLQIEYEKKKNLHMSQQLMNLQLQYLSLRNNYRSPVQQFKQKQKKYLKIIKEKKQKIETLIDQIQKMHDRNNKLMQQIPQSQKELNTNRKKLFEIQKDLILLQSQKQQVGSQRDQVINQVDQILREFKIELPENLQLRELQRKSSDRHSSDIYIRQTVKAIEKHREQVYWQSKDMQLQELHRTEKEQISKIKIKNRRDKDKDKRQDFAHKFKYASNYYSK